MSKIEGMLSSTHPQVVELFAKTGVLVEADYFYAIYVLGSLALCEYGDDPDYYGQGYVWRFNLRPATDSELRERDAIVAYRQHLDRGTTPVD